MQYLRVFGGIWVKWSPVLLIPFPHENVMSHYTPRWTQLINAMLCHRYCRSVSDCLYNQRMNELATDSLVTITLCQCFLHKRRTPLINARAGVHYRDRRHSRVSEHAHQTRSRLPLVVSVYIKRFECIAIHSTTYSVHTYKYYQFLSKWAHQPTRITLHQVNYVVRLILYVFINYTSKYYIHSIVQIII